MTINLPRELVDSIFDYVRIKMPIINKDDYKKKQIIYVSKSNKIKRWYKQYKIDKTMPILFLSEINEYPKWYIIRLYMKFYPKLDLYDWPIYYFKRLTYIESSTPNMVSGYLPQPERPLSFKRTNKAYDVFQFMRNITKEEIIKTGF